MLISLKNIHKTYYTDEIATHILKGISFDIEKGEFVAIMGPSGSGKSTLMHIIGLLDRTSKGQYKLDGQAVSDLNDNELALLRNKKIGFVFQAFHLLPRTTLLDNVKLPLIYSSLETRHGTSLEDRAKSTLESVGLGHRLDYFTNQISGGEKQRTAIARALINNPSVILADEPTGNLDTKSGDQVMQIFERLNSEGNTIILVTHEDYIAQHAKRIIKIRDGKLFKDQKNGKRRRRS